MNMPAAVPNNQGLGPAYYCVNCNKGLLGTESIETGHWINAKGLPGKISTGQNTCRAKYLPFPPRPIDGSE